MQNPRPTAGAQQSAPAFEGCTAVPTTAVRYCHTTGHCVDPGTLKFFWVLCWPQQARHVASLGLPAAQNSAMAQQRAAALALPADLLLIAMVLSQAAGRAAHLEQL